MYIYSICGEYWITEFPCANTIFFVSWNFFYLFWPKKETEAYNVYITFLCCLLKWSRFFLLICWMFAKVEKSQTTLLLEVDLPFWIFVVCWCLKSIFCFSFLYRIDYLWPFAGDSTKWENIQKIYINFGLPIKAKSHKVLPRERKRQIKMEFYFVTNTIMDIRLKHDQWKYWKKIGICFTNAINIENDYSWYMESRMSILWSMNGHCIVQRAHPLTLCLPNIPTDLCIYCCIFKENERRLKIERMKHNFVFVFR